MNLPISFLILFPIIPAIFLLLTSSFKLRSLIVYLGALAIAAVSIYAFAIGFDSEILFINPQLEGLDKVILGLDLALSAVLFGLSLKYKRYLPLLLIVAQVLFVIMAEFSHATSDLPFYFDRFSLIMTLIIGVIGTLICVHAVGYMKTYHVNHTEAKGNPRFFFFLLFIFLSAMFGIVFSNNLLYLFFFWEVTTACSFLLIGYTKTEEAINNSFRALNMNLLGGLAFSIAIWYMASRFQVIELQKLLDMKMMAILPVALLAFAGITKSAQMPFQSWLLGAMVAPSPTSALLHSSTMVKAGVFLLLKLSPSLQNNTVGYMVAMVGAVTFLLASFVNVTERNAKKVLAYSTIANLGLIVACAGAGTAQTVWVGIFLIIFHAVAKSLLFLTVGTTENCIHSKDIEAFDYYISRMPVLGILFVVGIASMFVAPFGIVISKWMAIKSFMDLESLVGLLVVIMIAYGSAATIVYWGKLIAKILSVKSNTPDDPTLEKSVSCDQWFSLWSHVVINLAVYMILPLISIFAIEPHVRSIFGEVHGMEGTSSMIVTLMLVMIVFLPIFMFVRKQKTPSSIKNTYLSGRNFDENLVFEGSLGLKHQVTNKNYYFETLFVEPLITRGGIILCSVFIFIMIGAALLWKI